MFVHNLNAEQQSALLFMAKQVAQSDNDLPDSEQQVLSLIRAQSLPGVDEISVKLNELPVLFDTNKSKCSLLLELIGVALINEEYHENEKALINQYADALGVSKDKLAKLEQWVSKQFALSKEAELFFN